MRNYFRDFPDNNYQSEEVVTSPISSSSFSHQQQTGSLPDNDRHRSMKHRGYLSAVINEAFLDINTVTTPVNEGEEGENLSVSDKYGFIGYVLKILCISSNLVYELTKSNCFVCIYFKISHLSRPYRDTVGYLS